MTKKILKVLAKVSFALSTILAVASVMAPQSYANVDQVQQVAGQIALSATKTGGTVAGTGNNTAVSTTTVMAQLYYNGPSTAAYITTAAVGSNSSLCVVFYAPYNVIDTSIGSATCGYTGGAFDLGVSTGGAMFGALADLINTTGLYNGLPRYHMTLVGAVRSDLSTNYLPTVTQASGVNNLGAVGGYQIPTSTASVLSLGVIPAQGRHVILSWCEVNVTTNNAVSLSVYGVPAKFGANLDSFGNTLSDSYLAWGPSAALASQSTTYEPTQSTSYPINFPNDWLEFANPGGAGGNAFSYKNPPTGPAYNGHVVIRAGGYFLTTAIQTVSNFLTCGWTEK
jgi:hypothetical protein